MAVVTDAIGDMLTRIRNAVNIDEEIVDIPSSNLKVEISKVLKEEGFIKKYSVLSRGAKNLLRVELKYGPEGERVISKIKRVSKPGKRVYCTYKNMPRILNGFGIAIVSTCKGIMTSYEARKSRVGGEILCEVS